MGTSTISIVIFNSYVKLPEGNLSHWDPRLFIFRYLIRVVGHILLWDCKGTNWRISCWPSFWLMSFKFWALATDFAWTVATNIWTPFEVVAFNSTKTKQLEMVEDSAHKPHLRFMECFFLVVAVTAQASISDLEGTGDQAPFSNSSSTLSSCCFRFRMWQVYPLVT